jgi:YidC/Oxa1 family membrane protein insertase
MSFFSYLFSFFIEPLKLLFEVVFFYAYKFTGNVGVSIVIISLVINILVLPLYKRADKLEKEQREKKKSLKPWVDKIKAAFKGDERVMMLQAYYRENDYKTTGVFKESVSLLLQIPFFMAAYSFLSELKLLQGVSLGPIYDLSQPDGLIPFGEGCFNALPILMTVINIIAGFIYTEKGAIKDKIKLVAIALVFLVLLYNSPAGLVFYWTLNNVFSLGKNIVTLIWKPKPEAKLKKENLALDKKSASVFMISCAALTVLTGVMIPSDVVVQNPAEMTNTFSTNPHSPLLYILNSTLIAAGLFMIWVPVFVYLSGEKSRKAFMYLVPAFAATGVLNYILFNKNFGMLSNKLIYDYNMAFEVKETVLNLLADIAIIAVVIFVAVKLKKFIRPLMTTVLLAVIFLSAMRLIATVVFSTNFNYHYSNTAEEVSVPLTKNGQNVVVIMMDKMNGSYIPYLFNERPDVAAQFDGFTYYPNTVSFGKYTNMASSALFGGYDYRPEMMNARADETLRVKHNEALLTMPVIFSTNGWNVTVGDPSYANYQWIADLSIYEGYENIHAYHLSGVFNDKVPVLADAGDELETRLNRNLFCYGFMKILPQICQPAAYTSGSYCYLNFNNSSYLGNTLHVQYGIHQQHVQEHSVLEALPDVTDVQDDPTNCFFVFSNQSTHDISLLSEPDYGVVQNVDNTEYDAAHMDRFTVDGVTMDMESDYLTYAAYESSMEVCISLGKWFDYLRENGIYDNTRIIIVADHGNGLGQFDSLLVDDLGFDAQAVNPVLLVKDFNSTGFTVSDEFMTNADTPTLAFGGIFENPINPFTQNPIYQDIKSGDLNIYVSENVNIYTNNGARFYDPDAYWLTVHDNIYDDENWSLYPGEPT